MLLAAAGGMALVGVAAWWRGGVHRASRTRRPAGSATGRSTCPWPVPCVPRPIPEFCAAAGALCYVNGQTFAAVPWQPAFQPGALPAYAWSTSAIERLTALLGPRGRDVRIVRLSDPRLRVRLAVASLVEVRDPATLAVYAEAALSAGDHEVGVPPEREAIDVVRDAGPDDRP